MAKSGPLPGISIDSISAMEKKQEKKRKSVA
jgi:hypothetical protein